MNKHEFDIVQQIWQAIFGVSGTGEDGMVGDFKELKGDTKELKNLLINLNGKVRSNRTWIVALRWLVGLLIVGLITGQFGVW